MRRRMLLTVTAGLAGGLAAVALLGSGALASPARHAVNPDVEFDAREPWQAEFNASFTAGANLAVKDVVVSAAKRLVLEHASVSLRLPSGQRASVVLLARLGGKVVTHFLPVAYALKDGSKEKYVGGGPVHIYQDPGAALTVAGERTSTVGSGALFVSLSGYLVDVAP